MFRRLGSGIRWRSAQAFITAQAGSSSRLNICNKPSQRQFYRAYRTQHQRHDSKILRSSTYTGVLCGAIFIHIALCFPDQTLDFGTRSRLGIELVQSVNYQQDVETMLDRYWYLGPSLLSTYCKSEVTQHGELPLGNESEWRGQIDTRVFSAPDPDNPEKNFVVCQVSFKDHTELEFYVSTHGNLLTDVAEDIIPTYERMAKNYDVNRGALLLLAPSGEWKSVYFDGKRYVSVVFLEWQTAASMGLQCE